MFINALNALPTTVGRQPLVTNDRSTTRSCVRWRKHRQHIDHHRHRPQNPIDPRGWLPRRELVQSRWGSPNHDMSWGKPSSGTPDSQLLHAVNKCQSAISELLHAHFAHVNANSNRRMEKLSMGASHTPNLGTLLSLLQLLQIGLKQRLIPLMFLATQPEIALDAIGSRLP